MLHKRAKATNWIWFIYNAFSLIALIAQSYSAGLGTWGKICAILGVVPAAAFIAQCLPRVGTSPTQAVMTTTFPHVILGHAVGAASLWGNGLSLTLLIYPFLLAIFFVYNQSFLDWTAGKR